MELPGLGHQVLRSQAPRAVWLIRLLIGGVFLSEGIQKFLFPETLGVGRFLKLGLPAPELLAPFVGICEIVSGCLILLGLGTRLAVLPTITIMLVALTTTKVPLLLQDGFWPMAHESRTDFSMLLGSIFLLIVGAGPWSLDHHLERRLAGVRSANADRARSTPATPPGGDHGSSAR